MESETRRFLEALFAGKPDELYLLLWTLPEKRSHWFQNIEWPSSSRNRCASGTSMSAWTLRQGLRVYTSVCLE